MAFAPGVRAAETRAQVKSSQGVLFNLVEPGKDLMVGFIEKENTEGAEAKTSRRGGGAEEVVVVKDMFVHPRAISRKAWVYMI